MTKVQTFSVNLKGLCIIIISRWISPLAATMLMLIEVIKCVVSINQLQLLQDDTVDWNKSKRWFMSWLLFLWNIWDWVKHTCHLTDVSTVNHFKKLFSVYSSQPSNDQTFVRVDLGWILIHYSHRLCWRCFWFCPDENQPSLRQQHNWKSLERMRAKDEWIHFWV